jgi:sulfate adenylyltransferase subunit 2
MVEDIPIVPLYFATERPVVKRSGTWIMVDDNRLKIMDNEVVEMKTVRFRTLGCYPLSGAIESNAFSTKDIYDEIRKSEYSERQGRLIDFDDASSMEKKKIEGYF